MAKLIETKISTLKVEMERVLGEFSNEESAERVTKRIAWRRTERPNEGEVFSSIGRGEDERLCIAAMLPGPQPRAALVAIWTEDKGSTSVEIIGAAREPDIRLKIFQMAETWRESGGFQSKQRTRKRWSGLESPE